MSDGEKTETKFTVYDEQRKKLDKLMMDPEKPVYIPSMPKDQKPREPREFIRNIWGSSAGVGSGDFHIYRGIRRRQMEREEYMEKTTEKQRLNDEYAAKRKILEEKCEERTFKKRLKRQRKKLNKLTKIEQKTEEQNDNYNNNIDFKIAQVQEIVSESITVEPGTSCDRDSISSDLNDNQVANRKESPLINERTLPNSDDNIVFLNQNHV